MFQKNRLHAFGSLFLLATIFFLMACNKIDGDKKEEDTNASAILKYIESGAQLQTLTNSFMNEFVFDNINVVSVGAYPQPPFVFYYDAAWSKQLANELYLNRHLSATAGAGSMTMEDYSSLGFVKISDSRLNESPYKNLLLVKKSDNNKRDWRFEMHIPLENNNRRSQNITISGSYSPWNDHLEATVPAPPGDNEVVSVMLQLIESQKL
jgi:hypothetical protein